ncbi:MAG: DUF4388 domain-containing protein [Pseudomonadota bacterium]
MQIDTNGFNAFSEQEEVQAWKQRHGEWKTVSACREMTISRKCCGDRQDIDFANILMAGEIRKGWLFEIANFIVTSKLTGVLVVLSGEERRELYFDRGALRMGTSSNMRDRLGQIMLRERLLTEEQLKSALEELEHGKRLGQVLVGRGVTTVAEVFQLLHRQVEEIFHAALMLDRGAYYFSRTIDLSGLPAFIFIDTQSLMMKTVERINRVYHYKELIPSINVVIRKKAEEGGMALNAGEADFLDHVTGDKTLREIAGELDIEQFDAIKTAYWLRKKGCIEVFFKIEVEDERLRFVHSVFNDLLDIIFNCVKEAVSPKKLAEAGKKYMKEKFQVRDETLDLVIGRDGRVAYEEMGKYFQCAGISDRIEFGTRFLNNYLFFILFSANSYLTLEDQQHLSSRVFDIYNKMIPM